jgi:hypothetical protein
MVRDESVAATNVEHVCLRGQHACDLERHVVRAPDFSSSSHAPEAALNRCA